jgi:putative aldouronate transport system permease protein
MNKKTVPFIIAVPSLILLFVYRLLPAINTLILSMKEYKLTLGLFNSPSVGLKNYTDLFNSVNFARLFGNTFRMSFFAILFTCFFAALLILCISNMPNRILKTIAIVIISIPAFIPVASFVGIIMRALSVGGGVFNQILLSFGAEPQPFLADQEYFTLIFAFAEAIRNVYIPVIIGVLACEQKGANYNRIFTVILIYAFVRATMFLSPDLELLNMLSNPLIAGKADALDTYTYRTGLAQMSLSPSSAVWVVKTVVQLLVNIGLYFLLYFLLPELKGLVSTLTDKVNRKTSSIISIIGFFFVALGSIGIAAGVFFPSLLGEYTSSFEGIRVVFSNTVFVSAILNSLIYCLISCIIYGFLTITLAYPLTTKTKIYPLILLFVMTLTNNIVGEFVFFRNIGLFNNYFAVILQSSLSVIGAFGLHFSVSGKFENEVPTPSAYIKEALLPLITIVGLFFVSTWGGYMAQLIYINNPRFFGIGFIMRDLMVKAGDIQSQVAYDIETIRSAAILISSIIPASLGALLICLNRILPLSAFSSQVRKG